MSVTLSSADLAAVARTIHLLVTPLDHGSADAWRSAVTRQVKALLHADTGGFLMTGLEGPLFHTEDFPQELIEGSDLQPPPLADGTDLVARGLELGVGKLELAYGDDVERYYRSDYFNDYADHLRKYDTLFTMAEIGDSPARGLASLQLFHESREGRRFGAREIALLRLLFPAFRAGAEICARWERHRSDLVRVMETLGEAAVLYDVTGRELHRTEGFRQTIASDPERTRILDEANRVAANLRRIAQLRRLPGELPELTPVELRTAAARYVLRGCLYEGVGSSSSLLVTLQRRTPMARTSQELRAEYGLTPAEVRVAFVLARGWSNAEIADDLAISPHTARRHTERVLRKLGVRARAEVASKLFS